MHQKETPPPPPPKKKKKKRDNKKEHATKIFLICDATFCCGTLKMLRDVLVHYDSGDDERTHKHWSSSSSLPVPPVADRVHVVASPRSVKAREKKNLTTNRTGKEEERRRRKALRSW